MGFVNRNSFRSTSHFRNTETGQLHLTSNHRDCTFQQILAYRLLPISEEMRVEWFQWASHFSDLFRHSTYKWARCDLKRFAVISQSKDSSFFFLHKGIFTSTCRFEILSLRLCCFVTGGLNGIYSTWGN